MDMAINSSNAYYSVGYNENQNPMHSFPIGSPQVPSGLNFGFDYTDAGSAFTYVTADNAHSYWARGTGGWGAQYTYVIAVNNSSNGSQNSFYTFPKGTTPPDNHYSSCIDFDGAANQPNPPTGVAVQQTGNDIFVSHSNLNVVRVFDKLQGNLLGSFTVTNPGRMAVTANGDVWVLSTTSTTLQRFTFANGTATLKQSITGLSAPAGLGVSADDSLLIVADGGASQQIKAFNNSTGALVWTYGTLGGMAGQRPHHQFVDLRVHQYRIQRGEFR